MKRRICVYTTNRAEYSKLRPILKILQSDKNVDLTLLVTGSHLLKQYGETKNQINSNINKYLMFSFQYFFALFVCDIVII